MSWRRFRYERDVSDYISLCLKFLYRNHLITTESFKNYSGTPCITAVVETTPLNNVRIAEQGRQFRTSDKHVVWKWNRLFHRRPQSLEWCVSFRATLSALWPKYIFTRTLHISQYPLAYVLTQNWTQDQSERDNTQLSYKKIYQHTILYTVYPAIYKNSALIKI
jgi:hypothetical protein